MYNSILHFIENDIKEIENLVSAMLKGDFQGRRKLRQG